MRATFKVYGDTPAEIREKANAVAAKFFGDAPFKLDTIDAKADLYISGEVAYWSATVDAYDEEDE